MSRPVTKALVGERYGRLVIVGEAGRSKGRRRVVVQCDCGAPAKHVDAYDLPKGCILSCGCLQKEKNAARSVEWANRFSEKALEVACTGKKECGQCGAVKSVNEFSKNKNALSGYNSWCKECCGTHQKKYHDAARIRSSEYYKNNKDKCLASGKEYRRRTRNQRREYAREYNRKNADKRRARAKAWLEKNAHLRKLYSANRKARVANATPSWVDMNALNDIYMKAGRGVHVDHIVPIKSTLVCGLHVPWNLQYLPAEENIRKSNLYWPDMPERE